MKRLSLIILLLTAFLIRGNAADGTPQPYYLLQLDNRNGLSNSAVNQLLMDSDDLLWAATWDGLNMYDGSAFHVFNYGKDNMVRSIGNNVVLQMTEDRRGYIWMSTVEGVSRYSKRTGRFSNYFYGKRRHSRISEQEYELVRDTAGEVFCLTRQDGLMYYDAARDSFTVCALPLGGDRIAKAAFDDQDRLWLLHADGRLEAYTGQGNQYKLQHREQGISNFYIDGAHMFLLSGRVLRQLHSPDLRQRLQVTLPAPVKELFRYKDHYLLAWTTQGFGVYDASFQASGFLQQEAVALQGTRITSFAGGRESVLWCGTDGNGIYKIYPQTRYFGDVVRFSKPVRAFAEVDGELWIGAKGSGIVAIRPGSEDKRPLFPEQLDDNAVFALHNGTDSLVYIGTDAKGIQVYDRRRKRLYRWSDVQGNERCPVFGSVYAILPDADGSLWLGTSGYGLVQLKINRSASGLEMAACKQYVFNGTGSGPANDIIYSLAPGNGHTLWVGCRYGGLSLFDKSQQTFRHYKAFSYDGSLSHNDVLSLYPDGKGRLWIGTSYGLNWLSLKDAMSAKPVFGKFTTDNGMPNNTIHAVAEDAQGNIWVSTNKGLARIDGASLAISHYQEQDGLQSNEFSDGAVFKDATGRLYFGGIYGFNGFLPADVRARNGHPNLLLSGIQFGGKLLEDNVYQVLKPGTTNMTSYVLERRSNFFELQLKAISYGYAEKCEYAYFLEGYDKTWHYSGGSGKVAYGNVPPGKYLLKVKWSNGEGNWTGDTPVMQLKVKQYFWLTWPAFLLYLLVIGGASTAIFLYRRNKLEMKYQLEMEHMLRKKEEEVHQEQLSFFTNIAHELQTPLTLIVGAAERNRYQENGYFPSLLQQQASRLTYLVQQLLEFRRAESGFLKNYYTQLDVSSLLENIAGLFTPLCRQKGLRYSMHIHENITGVVDKDKLEKILFNLLSNACKHSPKHQDVSIRAVAAGGMLEIRVFNSGVTIGDEQLVRLFTRFFAADTNPGEKFSAGIGLAFTRQLVSLLQGQISVSNEEGGVAFRVSLPLQPVVEEGAYVIRQEDATPSPLLQSIARPLVKQEQEAAGANRLPLLEHLEGERKSILVVEDEYAIRHLLRDVLSARYIIYEAANGEEALDLIRQTLPDLIISDVMMPGMNGLELCDRVKNAPGSCHIPFIILSARGAIENEIEGYEAGADAYIPKPFHITHLQVRVRKLLEYRERLNDLFRQDSPLSNIEEEDMQDEDRQFLQTVVKYIEDNFSDDTLSAAQLEKHMNLSKMQLYRKLKALSDMTPGEFIKCIRLKEAARLLVNTQLTVTEIFYRTGFNNQSYFFREFKKQYQCSPNEYRAQQTAV
ncbi:response regulator [Chitinophaga horti]|uniref:histidine kinase n=1 Tax=Chitinophaga horti TaxID=2920382 RepID=A0ABY6IYR2_9BACT|nr:two-component regulator propeller domain-containing protein [Chitinophaga horti]UYQ91052.1 response regulator [Chitinophaga horti]